MFHVFWNALGVKVAFGMPDFTIVEVVTLEVLFAEIEGRYTVHQEYACIGTTGCSRAFARLCHGHLERIFRIDQKDLLFLNFKVFCFIGAFLILVESPVKALIFVIMFLILQQIEGNLIYPHVVGNSVGLPSMWVLAAVTVGGKLLGVVGMLLFIPLCSVCYALFRSFIKERLQRKGISDDRLQYAGSECVSASCTDGQNKVK